MDRTRKFCGRFRDLISRELIEEQHYTLRKSTEQIGAELGCSGRLVRLYMHDLGLAPLDNALKIGRPSTSSATFRKGSSIGKDHRFKPGDQAGPLHPNWKGGRYTSSRGYIYIRVPDHPGANKQGYIFEHRLVMEAKLGRPLVHGEVIHHINHNPGDNRPENLALLSHAEHIWLHRRYNEALH